MRHSSALLLPLLAAACATTEPYMPHVDPGPAGPGDIEVMVLGTFHFAGSDRDLVNIDVDSVLTETRQKELQSVARALATFQPTVIVTERESSAPGYLDPVYSEFTPEWLKSKSNERVQLAYRVAHQLGLQRVYGLDEQSSEGEPDYFPFDKLSAHAAATGQADDLQALVEGLRAAATEEMERLSESTMAEALLTANTGPLSLPDFYYAMGQFDEGEAQPGAELQAYWFMRNAKIFSKLDDVVEPGDRVLVVYGAGHKFWLEHFASQTPGYTLVKPDAFLRKADG